MTSHYILEGKKPVPVDLITWARWFEQTEKRIVAQTTLEDGTHVSTVFLGIDHNFSKLDGSDPILFETMIFENEQYGGYQRRYRTWEDAEEGHAIAVAMVKHAQN